MRSPERDIHGAALTRGQADDVLRYWLAALRLEEALQARPMARRVAPEVGPPRLDTPSPGQDYFKLPLDGELAALMVDDRILRHGMDGELAQFFETWLYGQYRRGDEEGELSHLLCFPVVHLPRGELAGLLRYSVRLRFGTAAGATFRPPDRVARQRGIYPDAPDEVRVSAWGRGEPAWPFFVDTRLLRHPLGVPSEHIDACFEALRARETVTELEMLALLIATLEGVASDDGGEGAVSAVSLAETAATLPERNDAEALLRRLTRSMGERIAEGTTRARVYPVGIVLDGTRAKTTWHLQRELTRLLDDTATDAYKLDTAMGAYLTGQPLPLGEGLQRALFDGPPLTASQRVAADHFWGSALTAVQGPPGTGKTTLILHLCAEALVRQVEGLVDNGVMGDGVLLVLSSNNRAVDNVVDPLTRVEGLSLALRAGSRQVCEQILSAQLRSTLRWLEDATAESAPVRSQHLAQAILDFEARRSALHQVLAPRLAALAHATERERLQRALADLERCGAGIGVEEGGGATPLTEADSLSLLGVIAPLERRLLALSKLCEAKPGLVQVDAVGRHYARTEARHLPAFEAAIASAGVGFEWPLPPPVVSVDLHELMEAWEDATERCLTRLVALRERLVRENSHRKWALDTERLRKQLEALDAETLAPPSVIDDHAGLSRSLFAAAVVVREAWARVHAVALRGAVLAALHRVDQERSLRSLFRNDPANAILLRRLFGIWGSTLLSLGNCFPPDPCSLARVVIDEAGQCHPAHAVSALMRCETALVIGDVHQLAPVVEIGADDEARLLQACRLSTPLEKLLPYRLHNESYVSTQSLADRAVTQRHVLVDHFRCQAEIITLSDRLCGYGLVVRTPRATRIASVPFLKHPVHSLDVQGEQRRLGGSLWNERELDATLALVDGLLRAGIDATELAVITPYRGQLERLRRGLIELRVPMESTAELLDAGAVQTRSTGGVALGTVHRFQGGERSIVLFSSVITRAGSLAFLNARPNLLNVAVSRAQHHFICIGDQAVLARGARTRLLTQGALPLGLP